MLRLPASQSDSTVTVTTVRAPPDLQSRSLAGCPERCPGAGWLGECAWSTLQDRAGRFVVDGVLFRKLKLIVMVFRKTKS